MEYIYNLKVNSLKLKGSFFNDPEFGFYFFTEETSEYIEEGMYSLNIIDDNLEIKLKGDIPLKRILHKDKVLYCILLDMKINLNVDTLSLEKLPIGNTNYLFTGGDVLEYLAKICILPNGNYVIDNVQDYISVIERLTANDKHEFFFRGHYYYKYLLVPSLYRKKNFYENESQIYMDFKTQFYKELSEKTYLEILTTMQHYKIPTRLLDSTSNPLVALYMACDKPSGYKNNNYGIGEVIVMAEDVKEVKYSDSNIITLLSSLAVLDTKYKQELYEKIVEGIEKKDPSIYRNSLAYKRFVAEVSNEMPYFDESFFTPEVLLYPRHVKVGMINERIIAQSGNFILFGLCNYKTCEYKKLSTVIKPRLFLVNRERITKQLELLNINTGTMYPDKDHTALSIVKKYESIK